MEAKYKKDFESVVEENILSRETLKKGLKIKNMMNDSAASVNANKRFSFDDIVSQSLDFFIERKKLGESL